MVVFYSLILSFVGSSILTSDILATTDPFNGASAAADFASGDVKRKK